MIALALVLGLRCVWHATAPEWNWWDDCPKVGEIVRDMDKPPAFRHHHINRGRGGP